MNDVPELGDSTQIADAVTGRNKPDAEAPDTQDPRDARVWAFDFSYKDTRGKVWSGKFRNSILTIGQYRQVKIIKARLNGGVSVATLDASTWELNEMMAHLLVSLDRETMPAWAQRLDDLFDAGIVEALYNEVASHEARFHRRDAYPSASVAINENGTGPA
jgi:hypothetical protein